MSELSYVERPADGDPEGLLVLHHGRGSNEHDLIGLADVFDPERRLHVVSPAGPLEIPGFPGRHWYVVPRVGYPDPATFAEAYRQLCGFHDDLWATTGIPPEKTVLGGFSMGAVMSYATGLGEGRPVPAGILALSGFVPTVDGWAPELASRQGLPVFVAHGSQDPVIPVEFARQARDLLEAGGQEVTYEESGAAHHVEPAQVPAIVEWLKASLPAARY